MNELFWKTKLLEIFELIRIHIKYINEFCFRHDFLAILKQKKLLEVWDESILFI